MVRPGEIRILILAGCLYLVQGLPMGLAFGAYPSLMRNSGVALDLIAMVPLAGLPWVFKFLWAPFVENHWNRAMGRRKTWVVPMQVLLAMAVAGIALTPFNAQMVPVLLALLCLASFAGATQDIAADGLAAERLPSRALPYLNALQVIGVMSGLLLGGPGVMMLADSLGYGPAIFILAGIVVVALMPVLLWHEDGQGQAAERAQAASLGCFFKRPGAMVLLVVGVSATLGGTVIFSLAKLILMDFGWALGDIALVSGFGSSLCLFVGCALAVILVNRLGVPLTASLGLLLIMISGGLWLMVVMGHLPSDVIVILPVVGIGSMGLGVVSVTMYSFVMRYCQADAQPGTDFSIFQSSQMLSELAVSSLAMGVAARFGYGAGVGVGLTFTVLALGFVTWMGKAVLVRDVESAGILSRIIYEKNL